MAQTCPPLSENRKKSHPRWFLLFWQPQEITSGPERVKKKRENPVSVVNKCSRITFKASTAEREREFSRYQQSLWWEKQTTNQWRLEEATPCRHWQLISGKLLCCCCWLNRLIVRGAPVLLSQSAVIHSDQPQPHRGRLHARKHQFKPD